jgi:RNA polymerase sigma-70 factor (ECF subfamily)
LLRGDQAAFEAVVTEYYGSMVRLARAIAGPDSADDVVQEAWIAVLKGLSRFEGRSTLKTWILGIVVNMARQRRRQDLRFAPPPYADGQTSRFDDRGRWRAEPEAWHDDDAEQELSCDELRDCMDKAMQLLPQSQRVALTLRDIEGLDMKAICNILDVTHTHARVLLHRARHRLWEAIDAYQRTV